MSWQVKINAIVDPPYPTDSKYLQVTFSRDDGSGEIKKEYKLAAGNFKSAEQVTSFLADRLADLNDLDGIAADLSPLVGQEITTGAGLPERLDTVARVTAAVSKQLGLTAEQADLAVAEAVATPVIGKG